MRRRVVAIDGPAGSGKSSTAREVARILGFAHLDSGSLYRALALAVLDAGVPVEAQRIMALAESRPVRIAYAEGAFRPEVAGVDVSEAIRSEPVTAVVSQVAALPVVRDWVNAQLRRASALHPEGVVSDGRDVGTVVFPDAAVKVFLTASVSERARRRAVEAGLAPRGGPVDRLVREITARDEADSTRAVAPLRPAPDAVGIETTGLTLDEQVARVVAMARNVFN